MVKIVEASVRVSMILLDCWRDGFLSACGKARKPNPNKDAIPGSELVQIDQLCGVSDRP